ncbi:hypothetical protein ACFLS5_03050, partial [Candidatus Bipolaricaulota bacterium]
MQNVDSGDFVEDSATGATVSVSPVTASTYDVTLSGGTLASHNGVVGINLIGLPTIEDLAGNALPAGEPGTDETYVLDNTDPTDPTVSSTSHTTSTWSNDDTIDIQVSGAYDESGVDGFNTAWDQSATWIATEVKNQEETWDGGTFTATSNGNWYFHIATVDNVGNWTSTVHLGPFYIDTTPPSVPTGLSPANGAHINITNPVFSWTASTDSGGSGLRDTDRYSYVVDGTLQDRSGYVMNTTYQATDLVEEVYTWKIWARDNADNDSAYTSDYTLTIDLTAPGLNSFERSAPAASPTNADTLVFLVTFDEDVQNVDPTDFEADSTSTATVTAVNPVGGGPTYDTYEVTVSGGDLATHTYSGTVGIDLAAGQNITDLAGNPLPASEPATDETYTVDNDPPTISIGAPSATDTNTGPVTY